MSINVVLPAFPEDNGTRLDSFQHRLPKATRSKITGYTRKDFVVFVQLPLSYIYIIFYIWVRRNIAVPKYFALGCGKNIIIQTFRSSVVKHSYLWSILPKWTPFNLIRFELNCELNCSILNCIYQLWSFILKLRVKNSFYNSIFNRLNIILHYLTNPKMLIYNNYSCNTSQYIS